MQVESIHKILKKYWGYEQFRPLQEDIITSVMQGNDTLALLPTGGGKSICFQVPAIAMEGMTLVVSPLIALMKDQVKNLKDKHIVSAALFSGQSKREQQIIMENAVYGAYQLLYVSPERLGNEDFIKLISKAKINFIAVDEAHCISQWGYDFRPAYLKIAELKTHFPNVPILAVTATATSAVQKDIQEKLAFAKNNIIAGSFARDNLAYAVFHEESKMNKMVDLFTKVKGSGLIYVRNRKKTVEIANHLNKNNISADYYHAGLKNELRDSKQGDWLSGKIRVMVCTNAFGMGIDKPNVRLVIHYEMPDNLENYFQEAGRAGRDGKLAYGIALYNPTDGLNLKNQAELKFPDMRTIANTYQALGNFCKLAVGSGEEASFPIDFAELCKTYNLPTIPAYHAIKELERNAYINFSEDLFLKSKVKIEVENDQLYKFQVLNSDKEALIQVLLRAHPGIFENFTSINEYQISTRLKITKQELSKQLEILANHNIISYQPKLTASVVTYLMPRQQVSSLHIDKKSYEERKKNYLTRLDAALHYVGNVSECRSVTMLNYFGKTKNSRCGICDICKRKNELALTELEYENMLTEIENMLKHNAETTEKVIYNIKAKQPSKVLKVIQWLLDTGRLRKNTENKLIWVK